MKAEDIARETNSIFAGGLVSFGGDRPSSLPELLDAKRLQAELGVTRAVAEKLMRQLPVVQFEGIRKTYVRRSDIERLLVDRTFAKTEVVR